MDKRILEGRRAAAGALAAFTLLGLGAPPARGQVEVRTTVTDIPAEPELVVEDGRLMLQLEDAIVLALRRNLDLAVERYGHEQALFGIVQSTGIYDLRAQVDASYADQEFPSATQLEGVPVVSSQNRDLSFGLAQLTPWGGEAQGALITNREETNSLNELLNPGYFAAGNFSFAQPLLRDFGRLVTERPIIQARLASGQSREFFEQQVASLLQNVANAYWDLVEARDQLVVARQSLELAEQLHGRNRIQVEVGTLAPIELVQSEATIAIRQEDIITAQAGQGDAEDLLLQLLNLPEAMFEGIEIEPRTRPETDPVTIDVAAAIRQALGERPEVRQQQLQIERLEVDARYFHNQKLPSADVTLEYGSRAVAGQPRPGVPITVRNESLAEAFSDVFGNEFTGWTLGLLVAMPLQNRSARAQSTIADLDLEQGRTELRRLELEVMSDVRSAARAVTTAAQQIESARASVRLQERNLDAEQKRYENGMSTSFRITEIQEDLTQARSRQVSAVTAYRRALASYYRAIGSLLEENGVELAGPVEVELPRQSVFSLFR
jgi:outer membrane protein TolC